MVNKSISLGVMKAITKTRSCLHYFAFALVLIWCSSRLSAQINSKHIPTSEASRAFSGKTLNGIRLSAGYLKNFESEISFIISTYPEKEPGLAGLVWPFQYFGLGIEYLSVKGKNCAGIKMSYEITAAVFALQLGTDLLYSHDGYQWRFTPKIGLSTFGIWSLYYAYNFNLIPESNLITANHLISLQCNFLPKRSYNLFFR